MAISLKQGDEYSVPLEAKLNGETLDIEAVDTAEICLGDLRKVYPGEIEYDEAEACFLFPVTQEETFAMPANGAVELDVRIKFIDGSVVGCKRIKYLSIYDAKSEAVI